MPTIRAAWGALAALAAAGTAALTLPIPDPGHAADLPIAATSVIDGHAATWAPCRDIGYTLNTAAAPPGAAADTAAVLADLSRATGLTFTSRGATSRTPQPGTAPTGPADPDAPLTIAWAHRPGPGAGRPVSALLDASGDVAGKTVIVDAHRPRRGIIPPMHRIAAADVVLDADLTSDGLGHAWGGRSGQLGFLEHELAHAAGLDHTAAPGSVLAPALAPGDYERYPAGDVAALRALAAQAGPC